MSDLDRQIREAMGAHGCWKLQLAESVSSGRLRSPSAHIARDDHCTFGKWLRTLAADPQLSRSAAFQSVVAAHARFHQAAGHIAKCVETDRVEKAAELLNGADFRLISDQLGKAMIDWRQSLR